MKKSIAIVTAGLQFNGDSLKNTALGGSESALIYIAQELQDLNNEVLVFCDCDSPNTYNNVQYYHYNDFMRENRSQYDVVIVSRYSEFLMKPIDSKMNILWCHDISTPHFKESLGLVDSVFLLSDYQKQEYIKQYDIQDDSIIWTTTNGFDSSLVKENSFQNRKNNYIYSSRPERGLLKLLKEIWPEVLRLNPDAKLHLCGYNSFAPTNDIKDYYKKCDKEVKSAKNIVNHNQLPKSQYYELLQQCAYMIYPTDFPEISCINAIEAQANNCLVITSNQFALQETVKSNTKVDITNNYNKDFIELVKKYQDEELWIRETNKSKLEIQSYNWNTVANSWNEKIDNLFLQRSEKYSKQIIKQLVYNSDIVAASKFDSSLTKLIEKGNIDNIETVDISNHNNEMDYLNDRNSTLLGVFQELVENNPIRKFKILDIGSNDGVMSLPLLHEFNDNIEQLTALDTCEKAIEYLQAWAFKYNQLKPTLVNVNDDLTVFGQFDVIIGGEILEHIENTKEFINNINKLAHYETVFFFTTPKGPWESIQVDATEINHIHHFEYDDIISLFGDDINIRKSSISVMGRRGEECSNYCYWYTGPKIVGEIDYNSKFIKTRPYKSISVCMITKNEEDNLSRCLKTVKPIADEIIIVDTGSTDDTKRIAQKFTNNIYDLQWEEEDGLGNFARARNESIKHATGDYIFWIDADEQLENKHHLFTFIKSDYYDSVLVKQKHVLPRDRHEQDINKDPYPDRLFKNNGHLHFEGVIHEYVTADNDWVKKCLFQDLFWILHYGNTNLELLKYKSLGRNPALIEKNARLYPNSLMAKHYQVVDYWSKFVTTPSFDLFEKAYKMWIEHFINTSDKFAQIGTFDIIQKFYGYIYQNKLDTSIEPFKFTNGNSEIEFLAKKEEVDLFLNLLTN